MESGFQRWKVGGSSQKKGLALLGTTVAVPKPCLV